MIIEILTQNLTKSLVLGLDLPRGNRQNGALWCHVSSLSCEKIVIVGVVITVIWSLVILVIFVSGDAFSVPLYKYN